MRESREGRPQRPESRDSRASRESYKEERMSEACRNDENRQHHVERERKLSSNIGPRDDRDRDRNNRDNSDSISWAESSYVVKDSRGGCKHTSADFS